MNKVLVPIVAVVIAGCLWCLKEVHELGTNVRLIAFAVENFHSQPLPLYDADENGAVPASGTHIRSLADLRAFQTGYRVDPVAGMDQCIGAATQTLRDLAREDQKAAEERLLALLQYLTGQRCRMVEGDVRCG